MSLEGDKLNVLAGIYSAKEILFFFIGIGTLIAIPSIGADRAGTLQLVVLGAALTLEGFASIIEMLFNFMIERGLPWIKDQQNKRRKRVL
jgi:hypothetical protein